MSTSNAAATPAKEKQEPKETEITKLSMTSQPPHGWDQMEDRWLHYGVVHGTDQTPADAAQTPIQK
jgi:hypothetical protein